MDNCVFCNISNGKSPETKIEYENEDLVIFHDIKPASDIHLLAVPKKHLDSAKDLKAEDEFLLKSMKESLETVFQEKNLDIRDIIFGFHWPPFISVRHIHMHGIAPASKMGILSRWIFRPGSIWFRTPQQVHNQLKGNDST